jgi:hypothetical protein
MLKNVDNKSLFLKTFILNIGRLLQISANTTLPKRLAKGKNTLAYFALPSMTIKISFITLPIGPSCIKVYLTVICPWQAVANAKFSLLKLLIYEPIIYSRLV